MQLTLVGHKPEKVKSLSGFKKSHRVPAIASAQSQRYVAQIAAQEFSEDIEYHFQQIKTIFQFKRKEFEVNHSEDGTAWISTPNFSYVLSIKLDPEKFEEVIWTREISDFVKIDQTGIELIGNCFGAKFQKIEIELEETLEITRLIDYLEETEPKTLKLDYDSQATWCRLALDKSAICLLLTGEKIILHSQRSSTADALFKQLQNYKKYLQPIFETTNLLDSV